MHTSEVQSHWLPWDLYPREYARNTHILVDTPLSWSDYPSSWPRIQINESFQVTKEILIAMMGFVGGLEFYFFKLCIFFKIFYYSLFTMFYQLYSKVTQLYIYVHTHSFSHIILHHVPSQVTRYSSLCYTAGSHCLSTSNARVCIYYWLHVFRFCRPTDHLVARDVYFFNPSFFIFW